MGLVAKHYGGEAESRPGPTLAAEHLAAEHVETEDLAEHNRRFARPPAEAVDFHWEAPENWDRVFCLEEERVSVCEYRDKSLHLFWGLQELEWREVEVRPATARACAATVSAEPALEAARGCPWRRGWNLSFSAPPKKSSGRAEGEEGSPLPPDPRPPRGHFF